jgi:hypothetical protein
MGKDIYDLDVALSILGSMRVKKINEFDAEVQPDKKERLNQELDILLAEENALYSTSIMQKSVMDKAFRLYAPILKKEYATVGS